MKILQNRFISALLYKLLLSISIITAAQNNPVNNLLMTAITNGNINDVNTIIAIGVDINSIRGFDGATPLHLAVLSQNTPMIQRLLQLGADIEAFDFNGQRPLHYATRLNNPATIQLLLNEGANIEATDFNGDTALYHAVSENNLAATTLLLQNNADITRQYFGSTILDIAITNRNSQIVRCLLYSRNPATINNLLTRVNGAGQSAIAAIVQSRDANMMNIIQEYINPRPQQ